MNLIPIPSNDIYRGSFQYPKPPEILVDEKIQSIVGTTLCNHQKYEILFKKQIINAKSFSIICDLKKDERLYSNVPLEIAKNPEQPNRYSPYSYTFCPEKNRLVFGNYGLLGGMEEGSDEEDEEIGKKANFCLDISLQTLKIVGKIIGIFLIIFVKGGLEIAKKFK